MIEAKRHREAGDNVWDISSGRGISNGQKESGIRLTRRGWAAASVLGAGAVMAAAIFLPSSPKPAPDHAPETGTYQVQPGDSLSLIAQKVAEDLPGKQMLDEEAKSIVKMNPGRISNYGQLEAFGNINLPQAADLNPNQPGIQLEGPEK